jgi:hypothetical protein
LHQESFGVEISKSFTANLMKKLYFSSRMTRSVQPYRLEESFFEECVEFLEKHQHLLPKLPSLDMANALDEAGVWDSPSYLRSYAPVGW